MKLASAILAGIAIFCAIRAWMIYGGADNGTVLALYVIGAVIAGVVAATLWVFS